MPDESENSKPDKPDSSKFGMQVAAGAILGVGVGAAIGTATGDMSTGIWIGSVIGVGSAFAWNAFGGND